jgi:hypothetical protein
MTKGMFRGQTIDYRTIYGDLINLENYPYCHIQNGKGGNEPVINGSVEIKIGDFWIPVSELDKIKVEFPLTENNNSA